MPTTLRLCAAAILLIAAVPAGAQEGDPAGAAPFTERIDVELVTVDVWISDQDGHPVTGLEPSDFEVRHDGRPVAISHFTEVSEGTEMQTPVGAATSPSNTAAELEPSAAPGAVPQHVVVYFDQSRLHPSNYPALVKGVREFVEAREIDPQRVLVVRQGRSLAVEAPFGSSRQELGEALDRLSRGTAEGMDMRSEVDYALEEIRASWEQNQNLSGTATDALAGVPDIAGPGGAQGSNVGGPRAVVGGVGTGGGPDACGAFLSQIQPVLSSWTQAAAGRAQVTLSNLADISSFLAGLSGVKTLLYLSDGLETEPGAALATYATGFCPAGSTQLLSDARFEQLTPRFLGLTRHANANRVTIHTVQATGLRPARGASAASGRRARGDQSSTSSFDRVQRTNDRRGLELLASETGGSTVFDQNDLGDGLDRIALAMGTYYSLAYEPPAGDASDAAAGERRLEHEIEVRVADESLTARHRKGYLEKDPGRRLLEKVQGALNLGISENQLEIRLGAGEVSSAAPGSFRVPLHVMVPAERLVFQSRGSGVAAEVVVRVMTRSIDSSEAFLFDKTFVVPGEPGATGFADLTLELELPGGAHLTAVGVEDTASREASFVSTTLQIGSGG